jgi:hypothetical protein
MTRQEETDKDIVFYDSRESELAIHSAPTYYSIDIPVFFGE